MHGRWLALTLGLVCCGPKPVTQGAAEPPVATSVRPTAAELLAVANAVDPGPQAPLLAELPPELRVAVERALGTDLNQDMALREIREALRAWDELGEVSGGELVAALKQLGVGLILAERAVAGGETDAELLLALTRVYWILDTPVFSGQGMFEHVFKVVNQLIEIAEPGGGSFDRGMPVMDGLRRMFSRAGALHRRSAAEFLRRHGEHPEVPRVLGQLAEHATRSEDFAGSVALRQMAMRGLEGRATLADHADLAQTCYRALELGCGDAGMQRGRALLDAGDVKSGAGTPRLEHATTLGARARRVLEIPANAEPTLLFERGHLLLLLGRFTDARTLYKQLAAAHPEDARPHAGFAKWAIQRNGNFDMASSLLARGTALGSKDRDYYEVALGAIGMRFFYELLPALAGGHKVDAMARELLADLRRDAEGLRAYDPARASVVTMIGAAVEEAMPELLGEDDAIQAALRGALKRATALRARFPDSPDVQRMVCFAANFAADRDAALAAVRAPLAATLQSDLKLQRHRAQAWLDVTLAWEASDELPAVEAAVMALPTAEGERGQQAMLAAVLALQFRRSGAREVGERAAAMYATLAGEGASEARVVALNNLGVLKIWLGEVDEGAQHLVAALDLDSSAWPVLMNVAAGVLVHEGAQREQLKDVFAVVAQKGESSQLRLQARAWQVEQAQRGGGDLSQARAEFATSLAKERKDELRGSLPLARWGLISAGTIKMSFNYSVTDGFEIINESSTHLWLIAPAPGLDALVAASDQPAKRVKAARTTKPPAR